MHDLAFFQVSVTPPTDTLSTIMMLLRWVHFVAGITWVGLLYFFVLVNTRFLKDLDPILRGRVVPLLMPRALWWFRWAAVVTVLAGISYWMHIVSVDAHNAQVSPGRAIWSFFALWTLAFLIEMALLMTPKPALHNGWVLGIVTAVVVVAASYGYLRINHAGWESNRLLAIGIGGGMGWFMMFNVWGLIWRMQKKLIRFMRENPGSEFPEKLQRMARLVLLAARVNFVLSFPMLFMMGAASHYPMFGALGK